MVNKNYVLNDQTIYNDVAQYWWSEQPRWVETLQAMVRARLAWFDQFIDWQFKNVLDLGSAGGFMSEALHDRGASVTGIDPAHQAILAAERHALKSGRNINYDVGVGENLPYEDESYDAVVCVDVLEHVASLRQVLSEVHRVLRPGGIFLFDTINRNVLSRLVTITIAENVLGILPKGTHDPSMFIKPHELKEHLLSQGLVPNRMTGLGPAWINLSGTIQFAQLPTKAIIYMGMAKKPEDT